ncbi:MAG: hypothetical protein CNLJKLNK_00779 [Holosporales bacterium]
MSAARAEGLQEGIEKGKTEGFLEGKLEAAKNMKDAGLSIEDISKFTGLSLHDLQKVAPHS